MLDRLGRSVKNLVDLVGELHKQDIQFKSPTDAIDTRTPSGRFFFHVMASLAEMERELTVERTLQDWRLLANSAARVAENAR
jgi:DNA invertase Pin-like site-specific DNA recombinase